MNPGRSDGSRLSAVASRALVKVDVAEQRGDHTALRNAASTVGFQHDLQQVHHVWVIYPACHLGQQPVVPDIVKIGSQVEVEDACLPLDNCLSYSLDRVMCCPLGPISKRSRLEIRLEDRFGMSLSAPCTTRSRIAGIERTRTLPPSFGISCLRAGSGL